MDPKLTKNDVNPNFNDRFEFGDLKNTHNRCLVKIQRIHKLTQKNGFSKDILENLEIS